nr:MAG TPA: hypothetical protein [Caudoviricetes sp.]
MLFVGCVNVNSVRVVSGWCPSSLVCAIVEWRWGEWWST